MNKFKILSESFNESFSVLSQTIDRFPWTDRIAYIQWLGQTYYFVDHTTVFLTLMAGRFGGVDQQAHRMTLKHLREESGHDKLALRDLKAVGGDITQIPELLETTVFYQAQYYWIHQFGPVAHAGYSLMLEGLAAKFGAKVAKVIEDAHGKGTASFLKVHVAADNKHFDEGLERLAMAASPTELEAVVKNLTQSVKLYCQILEGIIATTRAAKTKKAA